MSKKRIWALAIGAFLIGLLSLFIFRFITIEQQTVHYHGNFALYINGEREPFDNFTYYEEVAACNQMGSNDPKTRVHMHDKVNDVVHVHDEAATWSAFFANLRITLADNLIQTEKGLFINGQDGKKLSFILNGEPVQTIANRVIDSEDVMLISFGNEDAGVLQKQYDDIQHTASHFNQTADPAACSGQKPWTMFDRAKEAVGV